MILPVGDTKRDCAGCGGTFPWDLKHFPLCKKGRLHQSRCRDCQAEHKKQVKQDRIARNPTCKIDNCDRNSYCRGWCEAHYLRFKRGRPIEGPIGPRKMSRRAHYIDAAIDYGNGEASLAALLRAADLFAGRVYDLREKGPCIDASKLRPGPAEQHIEEISRALANCDDDAEYTSLEERLLMYARRYRNQQQRQRLSPEQRSERDRLAYQSRRQAKRKARSLGETGPAQLPAKTG